MKNEFFVVGDVHGEFELLLDILKKWDEERQQLIFLGDLIDRGENSKACLELVWQLVREKEAICLTGNHERMFLAWLRDPLERYDHYRRNGGDTTINSLLGRPLDTPVYNLFQTQLRISQIWTSPDGKMGIDGGAVYGGVLHGIVLDDTGLVRDYTVGAVYPRKEIED